MMKGTSLAPIADLLVTYDGAAEFWMYKLEDFFNATQDPFYQEKIVADEDFMLDKSSIRMSVGKEVVIFEDGKVLPGKVWSG